MAMELKTKQAVDKNIKPYLVRKKSKNKKAQFITEHQAMNAVKEMQYSDI